MVIAPQPGNPLLQKGVMGRRGRNLSSHFKSLGAERLCNLCTISMQPEYLWLSVAHTWGESRAQTCSSQCTNGKEQLIFNL